VDTFLQEHFHLMDEDRKYRQRGYQDSGSGFGSGGRREDTRPRSPKPKLPLDVTGPRLPRLVETVSASRCFNCSSTLPGSTDFSANCPKCGAELHCCKQCAYFEPSTRFQCRKPIPERIALKDKANQCELFSPRVTVARDVRPPVVGAPVVKNGSALSEPAPKSASDARAAFDSLFKK
jgi:hypothetical protein